MTAKERQQKSNERRKLRGFKECKIWLLPASLIAADAEVARRIARGERGVSRQSVFADIIEAGLSLEQADRVELRHELARARAEIARLEEKVRYGRG